MRRPSPFRVDLQLAAGQRQRDRLVRLVGVEERSVDAIEQPGQLPLVRRLDDEDAAAAVERKAAVVEVVAIQRDQRAPQLLRELVVLHVRRAPQIVLLEHEEHVPAQPHAHVRDDARRHVRVRVDPRPRHEALRDRPQFLGQRSPIFRYFRLETSDFRFS